MCRRKRGSLCLLARARRKFRGIKLLFRARANALAFRRILLGSLVSARRVSNRLAKFCQLVSDSTQALATSADWRTSSAARLTLDCQTS